MKPQCLFKDFIGKVHYISRKGNAFQCFFNDEMRQFSFPYKSTYDSFHKDNEGNILAALILTNVPVSDWKWQGKILVDATKWSIPVIYVNSDKNFNQFVPGGL